MRPWILPAVIAPLAALAQETANPPVGPQPKVGVVAFAALSGDIPQRAGSKAAGMLANELRNTEALQLVEPKRPPPADPYREPLAHAKELLDQALGLRNQHKFRLAEQSLAQAIDAYKAAAAGMTDPAELQDTYVLLSAVQFNTGRDDDAQRSLHAGLALAPNREPPLAATSPLFARVVAQAKKALHDAAAGSLLVESTPAGAAVSVDGVALGGTPLMVKNVPPGGHVWRVQLPSGDATGGVVDVAPGKSAKVKGEIAESDPESRLLAALSHNTLDSATVSAAKNAAKDMEAELLVFGALSREGKNLALDGFLLNAASGEVRRLPRSTFDPELLSAGMELYTLAGEISHKGTQVGDSTRVPEPLAVGHSGGGTTVAEADYGTAPGKGGPDAETTPEGTPAQDGPRAPLGKSRKPLKR
jgi:hypothetical protein